MNERDNPDNTDPAEPDAAAADRPDAPATPAAPTPPSADPFAPPVAGPKPRWRDRAFRMRAVAAVAVAGVILGATGGAVTTALVSGNDHGDHPERFRFGPALHPGMPAVPPNGREELPGNEPEEGGLPGMPIPPGSGDGSEGGADQEGSLSQS